jgi:hypothetical protein
MILYPLGVFLGGPHYQILAALYVVPLGMIAFLHHRRIALAAALLGAAYASLVTAFQPLVLGRGNPSLLQTVPIVGTALFAYVATVLTIGFFHVANSGDRRISDDTADHTQTLLCVGCGKIWDDEGHWAGAFDYLSAHREQRVSAGLCPDCMQSALKRMAARQ